jgi:hypothetical protein
VLAQAAGTIAKPPVQSPIAMTIAITAVIKSRNLREFSINQPALQNNPAQTNHA